MAYLLYFYDLGAAGMLGPDEPRYASVARTMAQSGDWITPVLWGHPWFEKPALLYWMNAVAFRLGLSGDLAPRLPIALLSVAFLVFFWWILRREFGCRAAWFATLILSTTAGWIGYSQVGVTDLPLAATFSAAMLLALPWIARRDPRFLPCAAALLGFAVLAKSLVPLVLAAPLILYWKNFRDLLRVRVILPFALVALPWYLLCYLRNGMPFLVELFWKQQYQRVVSTSLQHVQHWWFYLPVLVALLLPWSPLLGLLARRSLYRDERLRFLLIILVWGMVFFSIPINKLWGYLLPLFPAAAALMGVALDQAANSRRWLAACAVLLPLFPITAGVLPAVVAAGGITKIGAIDLRPVYFLPLVLLPVAWILEMRGKRLAAVASLAAVAALGAAYLKHTAAGGLDQRPSARALWNQVAARAGQVCLEGLDRGLEYGLNYYAGTALPDCGDSPRPVRIRQQGGRPYVSDSTAAGKRVDPNLPGSVTSTLQD